MVDPIALNATYLLRVETTYNVTIVKIHSTIPVLVSQRPILEE